jgi:uncharacterized protein involved in response to NO
MEKPMKLRDIKIHKILLFPFYLIGAAYAVIAVAIHVGYSDALACIENRHR